MKDAKTFKHRVRNWIRATVNSVNSMHHSSVANFSKVFRDSHATGELPAVTPDIIARTRMDGGKDEPTGYYPKQRARILPEGVHPQVLGPDDLYLPEGARAASLPPEKTDSSSAANRSLDDVSVPPPPAPSVMPRKVKVTLRGSTSASFPAYRRQKVIFADTTEGHRRYRAQQNTIELCKDCWLQEYLQDCRAVQNRTMLHKCGPSCYKYSQDGCLTD